MPNFSYQKSVAHSASNMFNLVNDIASYPEFLSWCSAATVLETEPDFIKASITINQGGFSKPFTIHHQLQQDSEIKMSLIDGPFDHFDFIWTFESASDGCDIDLKIDYKFSNMLVGMVAGPTFEKIADTLLESFCTRADALFTVNK